MENVREMLETSSGEKRYRITLNYMQSKGITWFNKEKKHKQQKYRILSGRTSIHVTDKYFHFFCTEIDAETIQKKVGLIPTDNSGDKARPYAFREVSLDDFFKIVDCLLKNPLNRNELSEIYEKVTEEDIKRYSDVESLDGEECEIIVNARKNQDKIRRNAVKKYNGKCVLCGIGIDTALRASHIKSWADSTSKEKGDHENVLLLCANHDALFDKHLISFDDNGYLLISAEINEGERKKLNISNDMKIEMNAEMRGYMAYHRKKFEEK